MKSDLAHCNTRFVLQTKHKFNYFFTVKDIIPSFLRPGLVYKFWCGGCNTTYYSKTKYHCKVRMCEYLRILELTWKKVKSDNDSAIKERLLFCNHAPNF